jgi:hypothetical protein
VAKSKTAPADLVLALSVREKSARDFFDPAMSGFKSQKDSVTLQSQDLRELFRLGCNMV